MSNGYSENKAASGKERGILGDGRRRTSDGVWAGESNGEKLDVIDGQSLALSEWQSRLRLNLSGIQYSPFISSLSLML